LTTRLPNHRVTFAHAHIRAAREFFRAATPPDVERQVQIAAAKSAAAQKEEAAAARKRQLIADLERERLVRRARRRHKPTYILTPREPEPRGPERLAA
jgi:hypothetical protein